MTAKGMGFLLEMMNTCQNDCDDGCIYMTTLKTSAL